MLAAKPKRSKYGAVKVEIDGKKFDSKKEAARFCELNLLQHAGEISGLELQKKFLLIPSKRNANGYLEREVSYIADFVYLDKAGVLVVEDTKSSATAKKESYILKRKLMLSVYGITITEGYVKKKVSKK